MTKTATQTPATERRVLLTNAEKLRALADMADRIDLEDLLSRVRILALDLELQIERKRSGYQMDKLLGNTGDHRG